MLEYILIDGASSDGSVDVIKEYTERLDFPHRISYWTSEPDSGIYNAMNKGILLAHGELIDIMNSGDSFLPNALKGLKEIYSQHAGFILYGAFKGLKDGKFVEVLGHSADLIPRMMLPHNACFVPQSLYRKYGLYDESYKIVADYDLFLKFYKNHVSFYFLDRLICNYDMGGISSTASQELKAENMRARAKYGYYQPKKLTRKQRIKTTIKKIIKLFIPYGIIRIYSIVKRREITNKQLYTTAML